MGWRCQLWQIELCHTPITSLSLIIRPESRTHTHIVGLINKSMRKAIITLKEPDETDLKFNFKFLRRDGHTAEHFKKTNQESCIDFISNLFLSRQEFERDTAKGGPKALGLFFLSPSGRREGSRGEESRGGQGDWLSKGIRSASAAESNPTKTLLTSNYDQIHHPALSTHASSWTLYHYHMCTWTELHS